uniref:Fibronectin type-III domain-containing protein n=1 Tax=Meloidogyne hapla TaxID=6305 RepID=A0A1I8BUW7_MELHA
MSSLWDPPSSIDNILVRGYTLSYGTGSTDTRKVVLEGAESVEYTLNMLKPNTSYVLSLTAYNEAYGEDSSRLLLLIKTPSTNLKKAKDEVFLLEEENNNNLILPKPKGLKVEKTGNVDEFLLFWDEPKELINENKKNFIYYIVQYWKDSGQKDARKEELHKINVEHPPALLTGIKLINSNKYLAKVKLISSNGSMSQWSEKLPLLRKSEEKNNKNKWISGGIFREMDEAEEDFCGFELPSICDFFREGPWRWERRNSSRDGFSMVIREQIKTLKEFKLKNNELYGRLLSPMFNLKPSETFCVSVQTKLERGGFGAIFRVGIRYESEPKTLWLYRKSLQRFWPQGEWLRLSWQLRRKSNNNRGFQVKNFNCII